MRNKLKIVYHVCTGVPSWHQARAGHWCSGVTVCENRKSAESYLRSFKSYHPHEPARIIEVIA